MNVRPTLLANPFNTLAKAVGALLTLGALAVAVYWAFVQPFPERTPPRLSEMVTQRISPEVSVSAANRTRTPIDPLVRARPDSLAGKRLKTEENAHRLTGLTWLERQRDLAFAVDAFLRPTTSEVFQTELHKIFTESLGASEADFLMAVHGASDWETARSLILQRQHETGADYGQLMLNMSLVHQTASAEEIGSLVRQGAQLPDNTILLLARSGKADTIASLVNKGIPISLNYRDPVFGKNAIEVLIQGMGYFPEKFEPIEAAQAVQTLVSLGIETMPQDGSLDPLDYALMVNRSNAAVKLAITKALLEQGVPVQESHRQLLARIPECPEKKEFMELFANRL